MDTHTHTQTAKTKLNPNLGDLMVVSKLISNLHIYVMTFIIWVKV